MFTTQYAALPTSSVHVSVAQGPDPAYITRAVAEIREGVSSLDPVVQRRASAALQLIYREYAGSLKRIAARTLMCEADAEDVLHDVFLRLPQKLLKYQGRGLAAWLRQVIRNEALMRLRQSRCRREQQLADDAVVAAGESSLREDGTAIAGALRMLDPIQREVVVLRYFLGFSHQAIAQTLNITSSASEVRLCRALKQLRLLLAAKTREWSCAHVSAASMAESNSRRAAS